MSFFTDNLSRAQLKTAQKSVRSVDRGFLFNTHAISLSVKSDGFSQTVGCDSDLVSPLNLCESKSSMSLITIDKPSEDYHYAVNIEPLNDIQPLESTGPENRNCSLLPSNDSLDELKDLKNKNLKNHFLAYLNINHLCNKIVDLRSMLKVVDLQYISISETKLDASFPNSQFKIEGYHFPPFRRDRNSHGGGLMVFIKNDIIVTRVTEYRPLEIECICTKITISKKHWLIFSIYRPPKSNLENFI